MDFSQSKHLFSVTSKENPQNFEELFYSYHKKLIYYSHQIVGDLDLCEDLVQEVFISVAENDVLLDKEIEYIQNYLYKAVKNKSLNALRDINSKSEKQNEMDVDHLDNHSALHQMIKAEVIGQLYEALESLPEGCRQVSSLAYLDGKSNKEVAETLGISINTVKTQKQRGLNLLRLKLNPDLYILLLLLSNY